MPIRAFANRCAKEKTLLCRARFMAEYIDLPRRCNLPIYGPSYSISIAEWVDSAREHGGPVPTQGVRALTVFDEELELPHTKRPAIRLDKMDNLRRTRKQAPVVSLGFFIMVGKTIDIDQPRKVRLVSQRPPPYL